MFVEQGICPENHFWKYIWGVILLFGASLIGQIPLLMGVLYETMVNKKVYPSSNFAVMHFFEPNFTLFFLLLSFVFVFLGIYFVIRNLHHQSLHSIITARKKIDWSRLAFSFSLWAGFSMMLTLLDYWCQPEDFAVQFQGIPFFILFLISILLFPFQIGSEELIFRGYLMQGFGNLAKNKWVPLVMTSLIFGLMHIGNPEVDKLGNIILVYYIGTGFFLGITTLMDDGLELALGFHLANNLIGALLVTSDWSVFQTNAIFKSLSNPSLSLDLFFPTFVVFPILIFVFSKKYQWSNWKQRLFGKITL